MRFQLRERSPRGWARLWPADRSQSSFELLIEYWRANSRMFLKRIKRQEQSFALSPVPAASCRPSFIRYLLFRSSWRNPFLRYDQWRELAMQHWKKGFSRICSWGHKCDSHPARAALGTIAFYVADFSEATCLRDPQFSSPYCSCFVILAF